MGVSEIGNSNGTAADYQQYDQAENRILFRTYSYQNGKGQEKVYYAKDCVEISLDSCTIPVETDHYEEIKNMLKAQNSGKIAFLGNQMFSETYEVMHDYYDGKLSRDEVKNIFKEYFYHYMGTTSGLQEECGTEEARRNNNYVNQFATSRLAGLYEYFSRANTRNACAQNMQEGEELMKSAGLNWNGTYYYNSDWYYACEEMQELFRETANELADECGAEHVDFTYVEQNTRFTLDGGITYNGVWDSREWQINHDRAIDGSFLDPNMAPPKGFVYCSTAYWDGKGDLEGIREHMKNGKTMYSSVMFLLAAAQNTDAKTSLLLDRKNYSSSSVWEKDDTYESAISFLRNFNINWKFRGNRLEFLFQGKI